MAAPLQYESQTRAPLVEGPKDYHQVTEDIVRPIEAAPSRLWWTGFLIAVACLIFGIWSVTEQVIYGVGQWNLHRTIGWGWDITNFVWWVGIGHAGTLISAILLLFRQGWRTGVNRAAEAMRVSSSEQRHRAVARITNRSGLRVPAAVGACHAGRL